MTTIKDNLKIVLARIREAETRFHRKPNSILLLVASKGRSVEQIEEAISAGQSIFGENHVQEALEKMALLENQNIEWHFIGKIQHNKTKKIAENFSWVHSVEDQRMAKRLNDQRPEHLPPLNICIEVNVSSETTKAGVGIDQAEELVKYCSELPRIKLRGLMTLPAIKNTFEEQRAEFHKLRLLNENLHKNGFLIDTLSIGMTNDLEAAIAEGSTIVRVGTAIFGPIISQF